MKLLQKSKKSSRPVHFAKLFFLSYLKNTVTLTVIIALILLVIIDQLMLASKKQNILASSESTNTKISKRISSYISLAETLCRDKQLLSLTKDLEGKTVTEQLYISYEISELLETLSFSSPEISHISVITSAVHYSGFPSIIPLERIHDLSISECLRKNYTVFFDKYAMSSSTSFSNADNDKISIITPIILDDNDNSAYLSIAIPKFFFYTEFLRNDSCSAYMINSDDIILSAPDLTLVNNNFEKAFNINIRNKSKQQAHAYINNAHYVIVSSVNEYGLRTVFVTPLSQIRTWAPLLIIIAISIFILILLFALLFSRSFSKQITYPMQILNESISMGSPILKQKTNIVEINEIYDKYNQLLQNNKNLLSAIKLQQQKQTNAEMRALVAQINPHFLYNTLSVISWKAFNNNCMDICTSISKLGKLLQANYRFKSLSCRLRDELIGINMYLDLQKECFNNSFDYSIEIPDECLDLELPRFILQPIVENAVIHGFSQTANRGLLVLNAHISENLIINISDNGSGIDKDILEKLNSGNFFSERYGLANVNERIKLHCGEIYGLSFSSHSGRGTTVTITLPVTDFKED